METDARPQRQVELRYRHDSEPREFVFKVDGHDMSHGVVATVDFHLEARELPNVRVAYEVWDSGSFDLLAQVYPEFLGPLAEDILAAIEILDGDSIGLAQRDRRTAANRLRAFLSIPAEPE